MHDKVVIGIIDPEIAISRISVTHRAHDLSRFFLRFFLCQIPGFAFIIFRLQDRDHRLYLQLDLLIVTIVHRVLIITDRHRGRCSYADDRYNSNDQTGY